MDWHKIGYDFINGVLSQVIPPAVVAVSVYLIAFIRQHIEALKQGRVKDAALVVVKALAQTMEKNDLIRVGQVLAISKLRAQCPWVDPEIAKTAIEAAVHEVKTSSGVLVTSTLQEGQSKTTVETPGTVEKTEVASSSQE